MGTVRHGQIEKPKVCDPVARFKLVQAEYGEPLAARHSEFRRDPVGKSHCPAVAVDGNRFRPVRLSPG